ncbi:hypothetical protein U1Q18_000025 [Sarracenia purpurea var. burkii]
MRRNLGKFSNPTVGNATKNTLFACSTSSAALSTSAGGSGGGGRGRGRGSSLSGPFDSQSVAGKSEPVDDDSEGHPLSPFPSGLGHGRCKPLPSTLILPSFSSFKSAVSNSGSLGRGRVLDSPPPQSDAEEHFRPKRPIFFSKEEATDSTTAGIRKDLEESNLPSSIISVLSGAGRGKPAKQPVPDEKAKEENRHRRSPQPGKGSGVGAASAESSVTPRLSREDAVKKAVGILSRGGAVGDISEDGGRGRGGFRGRGNRGRGRGRGPHGWRGRAGGRERRLQDGDDDYGDGLYLGDNADGEKLAKRIGPEHMNELVEAFEEMSGRVLPSPMDDAYLDALHTNFMIECEPEYLMEEFGTNPDIDEKPPIPLEDALEKMKPFLMAYEGIQSHEEWEEVVKDTMEKVPIMKELVDYYSGPDRVTAKKQQEELERVAKTLPESAPPSVKRYTERAVLSLQSNPGWGFDKKCQFMDKLVWEVSQHYK